MIDLKCAAKNKLIDIDYNPLYLPWLIWNVSLIMNSDYNFL